ncbi:putative VPS74-protein [Clavulina sp. PMI_390]|nr:putative VPS74-protein [Clavulina sp. PMI_390]
MSEGLSRRRVGGGGGGGTVADESGPSSSAAPTARTASPAVPPPLNGSASYGGTALEGGNKVAYDPRDLVEQEQDGGKMPKLTLLDEVLLLGLKDKQGYLSFWNDNISYALRGCIILELALRRRIAMVKDSGRKRYPLPDRFIEVIDERQTGETLLDEALKMIKLSEKMGVGNWIDLMSGETWNVMKIGYQLKQVRERIAKGLVDKGVLRTEKRNFFLFDMATHPVADGRVKEEINSRVIALLSSRSSAIPPAALSKEEDTKYRITRAICLVVSAYAANVVENPLQRLAYESREACLARCDEILSSFSTWPFGVATSSGRRSAVRIAGGSTSSGEVEGLAELVHGVKGEMADAAASDGNGEDLSFEIIPAVLEVFGKMDSLL